MEGYNLKKVTSNDKGITLVALIVTVVVMLIIIGISINSGTESLDTTRLQGFYMQLETIQKKADDIAITNEIYVNSNGKTIDVKNYEEFKLTASEKTALTNTGINLGEIKTGLTADDFRYFTIEELDTVLDLTEMQYNVFIHFDTRTIIAEKGININGQQYYMLENNIYFPEYDNEKNKGKITLTISAPIEYGTNRYKIIVTPSTVGDLVPNGTLRYKKTTTKYWETANGLEIIVSELTKYNIEYKDRNNNVATGFIDLTVNEEGEPILNQHEFTSKITVTPGCTTNGIMTYTCNICGEFYTEAIHETGHVFIAEMTKTPTVTTEGEITYTCNNCGYKYTEIIAAVGQ